MIKNDALNFIIKTIQWGDILKGDLFYSEKALAIKLGISHSTAKTALNIAEGMGLLISFKGKGRIVANFARDVLISKYISLDITNMNIKRKKVNLNKSNSLFFLENNFIIKKNTMKVELSSNNEKVLTFFSTTDHELLFKSFFENHASFLKMLKKSNVIINKITKKTTIDKNGNVLINRNFFSLKNKLIESCIIIINPKYYVRERSINYFINENDV